MAQEINEGMAYLRALKGPAGSESAAAAAPARETSPEEHSKSAAVASNGPQEQFRGAEKRRSSRYKCEGSVEMREDNCDVRTWATFTDISLHGCYVEAQATYPVGTILHMRLEAGGFKIESKGNVRVNYSHLGMGIAFVDMPDPDRKQLKDMLGAISRPSVIMGPGIASSLPASGPLNAVPLLSDPGLAIQALIAFFEDRQMLMREDFLRILQKSQTATTRK